MTCNANLAQFYHWGRAKGQRGVASGGFEEWDLKPYTQVCAKRWSVCVFYQLCACVWVCNTAGICTLVIHLSKTSTYTKKCTQHAHAHTRIALPFETVGQISFHVASPTKLYFSLKEQGCCKVFLYKFNTLVAWWCSWCLSCWAQLLPPPPSLYGRLLNNNKDEDLLEELTQWFHFPSIHSSIHHGWSLSQLNWRIFSYPIAPNTNINNRNVMFKLA